MLANISRCHRLLHSALCRKKSQRWLMRSLRNWPRKESRKRSGLACMYLPGFTFPDATSLCHEFGQMALWPWFVHVVQVDALTLSETLHSRCHRKKLWSKHLIKLSRIWTKNQRQRNVRILNSLFCAVLGAVGVVTNSYSVVTLVSSPVLIYFWKEEVFYLNSQKILQWHIF